MINLTNLVHRMKYGLVILLFFTFLNAVKGQFGQNHAIYLAPEMSLGNYFGIDAGLNYVYKEKYSFQIGASGHLRVPKSQPEDYSRGMVTVFTFGLHGPFDQMETYKVAFGRVYTLNEKRTIRVNALIGLGYTKLKRAHNWQWTGGFITGNYNWEYQDYHVVSIIINPKIEFPLTRIYGLNVSPIVQINKRTTYFGVGIGHMLGLLKAKRPFG